MVVDSVAISPKYVSCLGLISMEEYLLPLVVTCTSCYTAFPSCRLSNYECHELHSIVESLNLCARSLRFRLDSLLGGLYPNNDFVHTDRGKPGPTRYQHFVRTGTTQLSVISDLSAGEVIEIGTRKLLTLNAEISFKHTQAEDHEIVLMQRIGMSRDIVSVKFDLITNGVMKIVLAPRPGVGVVYINPGTAQFTKASLSVTDSSKAGKPHMN